MCDCGKKIHRAKVNQRNISLKLTILIKSIFIIIGLVLGAIINSYSQNRIIAGQTNGTNIHYIDYLPDSSIYLGQNDDGFKLDIDGNGTDDLLFNMGITNWLPNDLWTWSTVQILNENVKICLNDNTSNWIDRLDAGDAISENNIWSSDVDTLYYFQKFNSWTYPPPGGENSEGEYGIGYMGFQMNFSGETFYGWIHVEGSNFTLTAGESAICGLTVGISEINKAGNTLHLSPNPFNDLLTIEPNLIEYDNAKIELVNLEGKIVKTSCIEGKKMIINTSLLTPGIYFVRIIDGGKIISQKKVIKI